ncbi:MAG: hypothetical protein E1N59_594 [Puniceicoccaceae bacterium 5H]|nr:MAG: hypothetical protein E1N59_594 [Puniceicoccaceae bacterium 5H]
MKSPLIPLSLLGSLIACPIAGHAKADLDQLRSMASQENLVYFEAPDFERLNEHSAESVWGQIFQNEDFQSYLRRLISKNDEEEAEGFDEFLADWEEYSSHFDGPVVATINYENFDAFVNEEADAFAITGFVAIGHDDKSFWEKDLKDDEAEKVDVKLKGFDLYKLEDGDEEGMPAEPYLLLGKDLMVLAFSKDGALSFAENYHGKSSSGPSLTETAYYQQMVENDPDADFYFYGNLQGVGGMLDKLLENFRPQIEEAAANGQVVGVDQIKQAIGYDSWRAYYFSAGFDGSESYMHGAMTYENGGGLLGELVSYYGTDLPQPMWVPADAPVVTVGNFDFSGVARMIERLVGRISPMGGGMYTMMKNQLKMQQIDIDGGLIGNLGSQIVQVYTVNDASIPGPVTVISLRDGAAFARTVSQLTGMQGMPLSFEDYNGARIASIQQPQVPTYDENGEPVMPEASDQAFTLATTADQLVYGMSRSGVEEVLDLMAGQADEPLLEQPELKAYLSEMPDDTVGYAYYDVNALLNTYLQMIAQLQGEEAPHIELDEDYIAIGSYRRAQDGLYSEGVVKPRQ